MPNRRAPSVTVIVSRANRQAIESSSSSQGEQCITLLTVWYPIFVKDGTCNRIARYHTLQDLHGVPVTRVRCVTCYQASKPVALNSPNTKQLSYSVWGALQQMVHRRKRLSRAVQQVIITEWKCGTLTQQLTDLVMSEWR